MVDDAQHFLRHTQLAVSVPLTSDWRFRVCQNQNRCSLIREGHGEAYYASGNDVISMPAFEVFKGADHFYCTAFHELTHWIGTSRGLIEIYGTVSDRVNTLPKS